MESDGFPNSTKVIPMANSQFTIHMIGHGHIDPTWLWRWTEGYEEVRATFRSALDRMNETPDFTFTSSSACFYAWVKACDPEMFEEIRARVAEGRWDIVGGWWTEPDCNVPGGEALVRHGLYSQRFFLQEFGRIAEVGFNPDSFGHTGTLPQIYSKMGIGFYIYMRPEAPFERKYPGGTTFRWKAKDGSEIIACALPMGYGSAGDNIAQKIYALPNDPYLNPGQTHVLGVYGVGNHGGGPTKKNIADIIEIQQLEDVPRPIFSTLKGYFDGFLGSMDSESIPSIDTDLQHHARGCYSVHSEVKRLNRKAEHALMAAERLAAAGWLIDNRSYPKERFESAWHHVLYNQFHDILAGTSIETSYDDTRDQLGAARNTALEIQNESLQSLAGRIDTTAEGNTIMVVNPLPWPVKQTVKASAIVARELQAPLHAVDASGKTVPSQAVLGERIAHTDYIVEAEVPALGYRCYHMRSGAEAIAHERMLEGDRHHLENDWWRIEFDPYTGIICRLFDKQAGLEVLKKGNILACMVDQSDTWSHGYEEWRVEAGRFGEATLELLELGDVRATVRIVQKFGSSTVDQCVSLHRGHPTIDCRFRINWQERYTLLKLGFETKIRHGESTYDVAYGCQERDSFGFEEPGQRWIDFTGEIDGNPYGLAVLNDSKYSFDICEDRRRLDGGTMRVTLLRSPAFAYHDRARHDASEPWPIMDQGWQTVRVQLVPHTGPWQEAGVVKKAWELNEPAFAHIESGHKGDLPAEASFLGTTAENVLLSVLKQSEEGENIVVRGYETAGREVKTKIELPFSKQSFEVSFGPHEIKTLRIDPTTWAITEIDLIERG